jgi:hypothetical protein
MAPKLSGNFSLFTEREGSLPHSKQRAKCSYPEPHKSSPWPQIPLHTTTTNISFQFTLRSNKYNLRALCCFHCAFSIYEQSHQLMHFLLTTITSRQMFRRLTSPDDGDIRRRNICREVIVVNKTCICWSLCSYNLRGSPPKILYAFLFSPTRPTPLLSSLTLSPTQYLARNIYHEALIPVAARSKAWVCGRSLAGIVG